MRTLVAFVAGLLALAVCVPVWAQSERTFSFDNGAALDPGLSWSFARSLSTFDIDGTVIPAQTPRYAQTTLLCGAPDVTTVAGTTAPITGIHAMSAGFMADNTTPAWLIYNVTQGKFQIHVGSVNGAVYSYNVNGSSTKGNTPDLLKESYDVNPNEAWTPRSATICHGFAVALCNVATKNASGVWHLDRVGIAVCNMANLTGPKGFWWRRQAVSDRLDDQGSTYQFGALWSLPRWWVRTRDGQPPTEFWITATDYRAFPQKDGGMYFVMPVRRSSETSSDWVADKVMELPGRFARFGQNVTHAHAAGLCGYGEQGLMVLGSRGDSLYNNANYTWTIDDASMYRAGATVRADSYNWYVGGTNWAGPKLVNGFVGDPVDPVQLRRPGNQWIGVAPGPTDRTFVLGSDEVHDALFVTPDMSSNPDELDYFNTYGIARVMIVPTQAEGNATPGRFLSFHIQCSRPNGTDGQYVAQLAPSQFDPEKVLSQRILYSPDGINWGQMWAHRENEQTRPVIGDGKVWIGSAGQSLALGLRSTPIPATKLVRPLSIAPGGVNLTSTIASAGDMAPGVSITPVQLPDNLADKPAADGPAFLVINAPTSNATAVSYLGSVLLAPSIPKTTGIISFRIWVRNALSKDQSVAGSLALRFRLRSTDDSGTFGSTKISGYAPALEVPSSGDWVPVTLTTNVSAWGTQPTNPWLELLVSTGSTALPCAFHMMLDSTSQGPTAMYPTSSGTVGTGEQTSISFDPSASGDVTALVAAMVPWHSWGSLTLDPTDRPLFSLVSQDGTHAAVVCADPIGKALKLKTWVNGVYDEDQAVSVQNIYWMQGSPVLCGMTYEAATSRLRVRASVGGNEITEASAVFPGFAGVGELVFGDPTGSVITPLYVFGGKVDSTVWDSTSIDHTLRTLDLIPKGGGCVADFDHNGFVNGNDYDLFADAFDAASSEADINKDGFVNGNDYDLFADAFDAGC